MRSEQKGSVKNSVGRLVFALLCIIIQIVWINQIFIKLQDYSAAISVATSLLAFFVVMTIYGKHTNAAFKMPWIIFILTFPVFGLSIYYLFGRQQCTKKMRERFEYIHKKLEGKLKQSIAVFNDLENTDFTVANQSRYIWNCAKYPVYKNTDIKFHSDGTQGLNDQLHELKKAKKFIFMEYHAIEEATAFEKVKAVLAAKVKEGVEVRIFYDDVGSVGFINTDFVKRMEAEGIQCKVFNPIMPVLNIFMNNRDHRKITVIDGEVGFTGGYNLADEYFNITHPYGYWKDTGIKLMGDAVRSLTVMFLEMWNAMKETDEDFDKYLPECSYISKNSGFVQPYADSPLDGEATGENVYLNIIKSAKHELYVATPYLIISDEMTRELGLAAKRGVDVRVVTPAIPDKKLVFQITRSYYSGLVRNGVRIFEFTPGFLHAKQVICDRDTAVVGTINFDYRSLYHHFENAVFLYKCKVIEDVSRDFEEIFSVSEEVTDKYREERSAITRIGQSFLRLISPLL